MMPEQIVGDEYVVADRYPDRGVQTFDVGAVTSAPPPAPLIRAVLAKLQASATATRVTLESMRTHGGYGYTAEFPVERHYRDAARLASTPTTNAADRAEVARRLTARGRVDDGSGLTR